MSQVRWSGCQIATPLLVPTQSRPRRSSSDCQTTLLGRPSALVQAAQLRRPGQRFTPAPPSPIHSAPAGKPLTVSAQVRDPSGVAWVHLRYRSVTQFEDYRTLEMRPTGRADEYQATVPGAHLDPQWDWMYLIEVMDACGNGAIHPDLEVETPYVVVRLER